MVCALTPYQDVLVFSALKDIKWLDNCSSKSWQPAKLLKMANLIFK